MDKHGGILVSLMAFATLLSLIAIVVLQTIDLLDYLPISG